MSEPGDSDDSSEFDAATGEVLGPEEKRAAIRAVRISMSGPLPPPQILEQYNDAVPDGADRIVRMAENQAAIDSDRNLGDKPFSSSLRSQR